MKKYNLKKLTIALLCISATFFVACSDTNKKVEKKEFNTVEVAKPQKRILEIWDKYTAKLEGEKAVELCPVCQHPKSFFMLKPNNY